MATTVELNTVFDSIIKAPIRTYAIAGQPAVFANTKLLAGTMIMNVAGVLKKAATAIAGSVLMGVLESDLDNSASGSNVTFNGIFRRGSFFMANSVGDPCLAADVGALVAIADENTIKHTIASNDLTVRLLEISSDGTQVRVETV